MMKGMLMTTEEFLRSSLEDEERKLWRDVAIAAVNCPGDEIEARHAIMWADEITAAYMDKFDKKNTIKIINFTFPKIYNKIYACL